MFCGNGLLKVTVPCDGGWNGCWGKAGEANCGALPNEGGWNDGGWNPADGNAAFERGRFDGNDGGNEEPNPDAVENCGNAGAANDGVWGQFCCWNGD